MFFAYRKFLQKVVEEQRQEIKELQARNDKLVEAMVPILRRMNENKSQEIDVKVEIPGKSLLHKLTYGRDKVSCSCGWAERSEDPGKLQELASAHHRENTSRVQAGRKSWPAIKSQIEDQTIGGKTQ